ncbi:translation initiation factor IF-2-like isoform X1 [Artibeus jamaicensis]|uniref:translation initiation factor IF-2-like isoform X1 n=1 Tax=Artibeus jamaicensis TaxID=9417 RepID=UPI00235AE0AB|nr:translation initiation factor IF-2-like isoform X1 [Artibeus jamaicensis]
MLSESPGEGWREEELGRARGALRKGSVYRQFVTFAARLLAVISGPSVRSGDSAAVYARPRPGAPRPEHPTSGNPARAHAGAREPAPSFSADLGKPRRAGDDWARPALWRGGLGPPPLALSVGHAAWPGPGVPLGGAVHQAASARRTLAPHAQLATDRSAVSTLKSPQRAPPASSRSPLDESFPPSGPRALGQRPLPQPGSEATVEEQPLSPEQHSRRNILVITRLLGGLNPSSSPPALSFGPDEKRIRHVLSPYFEFCAHYLM